MNGIIVLNKETNITSFSACNRARRLLSVKKAGHSGTLDPMAAGVLTVALANATRFLPLLPNHNKSYIAEAQLGITTDTLDITGNVLSRSAVNVKENDLLAAAEKFKGEIKQVPPMYSAVTKDGKRLYELARHGIEVEREPRSVTIHSLKITHFFADSFTLEVSCSSGTYIRTLIDDIGRLLGCGAVMTALTRTEANGFSIKDAHTLSEIQQAVSEGCAEELIIPVESCFRDYPCVNVSAAQAVRFSNGGELSLDRLKSIPPDGICTVFSPEGVFLGLGEADSSANLLKIKRIFVNE